MDQPNNSWLATDNGKLHRIRAKENRVIKMGKGKRERKVNIRKHITRKHYQNASLVELRQANTQINYNIYKSIDRQVNTQRNDRYKNYV